MRTKTAAPFLSTLAGIPKMLGGLFSRRAATNIVSRAARDKTTSSSGFWGRNFSWDAIKQPHLQAMKDPKGSFGAFLGIPSQGTQNFYNNMAANSKNEGFKQWATAYAESLEPQIAKNKEILEELATAWKGEKGNVNVGQTAKQVGRLLWNNRGVPLWSGIALSSLPIIGEPLGEVARGETGLFEGLGRSAGTAASLFVPGPFTQSYFSWPIREAIGSGVGSAADSFFGTAAKKPVVFNPYASLPPQMQGQIMNQGAPYGY